MNVCVIGTGHMGLVTGAWFAELGKRVTCADTVDSRVAGLQAGEIPIFEPGLDEIVTRNVKAGRLCFTTDLAGAVRGSLVVFIAVDSAPGPDGQADLSSVEQVAKTVGENLNSYKLILTGGTAPAGIGDVIREVVERYRPEPHAFGVVSSLGFLRERSAIEDFLRPNRVLPGAGEEQAAAILEELYRPLLDETPCVATDVRARLPQHPRGGGDAPEWARRHWRKPAASSSSLPAAAPETLRPAGQTLHAVQFGPIRADAVSMVEAVDAIARRAASGKGGFVLTPNVDHIALSLRDPEVAAAYERAFLALADGMPLVALSRLLRLPLKEKVSGSDLFEPLMARCARDRLPVFFMGATQKSCEDGVRKLQESYPGIEIAGYDASTFDPDANPAAVIATLHRARDSGARLIVVCLPARKQLLLARFEGEYHPAVGIGAGVTLSFYAGEVRRAPTWVSRVGLEWLYRLVQEPRRLWRRYLVDDLAALPVLGGMVLDRLRGRPLTRIVEVGQDRAVGRSFA